MTARIYVNVNLANAWLNISISPYTRYTNKNTRRRQSCGLLTVTCSHSHVQGLWSPGCDCWSVVQSASAIVFTLTFAPVLHRVSALTPTPLLLSSLADMLEAGLTPLCLVWSNSHCGVVTTLTLVSLVLWVFTMTSTPLQLSLLVDKCSTCNPIFKIYTFKHLYIRNNVI